MSVRQALWRLCLAARRALGFLEGIAPDAQATKCLRAELTHAEMISKRTKPTGKKAA